MVPGSTGLPLVMGPNCTSAVPTAGVAASGAVIVTVQSFAALSDQPSVTLCEVPSASKTLMSDAIGTAAVAVPGAGVAGRFAARSTLDVATGFSAVCVI